MKKSSIESTPGEQGIDRRSYARYPVAPTQVSLIVDQRTVEAELFDQSIGGVAVVATTPVALHEHQEVEIETDGDRQTAYVRAVRPHGAGFRISLSWDPKQEEDERDVAEPTVASNSASYFSYEGCRFVCRRASSAQNKLFVTLWNGRSFPLTADLLVEKTRDQRRAELQVSAKRMKLISEVYGLPLGSRFDDNVEAIVDFEFNLADE